MIDGFSYSQWFVFNGFFKLCIFDDLLHSTLMPDCHKLSTALTCSWWWVRRIPFAVLPVKIRKFYGKFSKTSLVIDKLPINLSCRVFCLFLLIVSTVILCRPQRPNYNLYRPTPPIAELPSRSLNRSPPPPAAPAQPQCQRGESAWSCVPALHCAP